MPAAKYDLVILGSGSTAFAAALRAAELGRRAAMTEARTLGGTCVNRGCLPSKNLIEAAKIVHEARHPRFPGLKPCSIEFDFAELIGQKDEVVKAFREKKYVAVLEASERVALYYGRARFLSPSAVSVDDQILEGDHFLIATGSRPHVPEIEGLESVPYLTSDLLSAGEPEELTELPLTLLILGGGYIALELGQLFHRLGTKVTILQRSPHILGDYEPEVASTIARLLRQEGIELVTGARVERVYAKANLIIAETKVADTGRLFSAEKILVATGRRPNTDGLDLPKAGVQLDEAGFVLVNEYLQTNVPHVWAAGDVIGRHTGSQLATPVGSHDGRIAASNALGASLRKVDHSIIPRTIFTDPQVAVVGLTEAQAVAKGYRCWCNTITVDLVPRAGAARDTRGIVKMVADADTNRVLGVSLVMRDAGEVIHEAAMALRFGATVDDFIDLVHVYPTMAEALKLVAISRYKDPAKLSCCAE
jgi:mercuric reductase